MSADGMPIRSTGELTVDEDAPAGRVFIANCTVAGDVTVVFLGGSTHVIAVDVGYSVFPYSIVRFTTAGTDATATFSNGA